MRDKNWLLLLLLFGFFVGCEYDDSDFKPAFPQADFNYVVVKEGDASIISFVNNSVDGYSFEWQINKNIVFKQRELTLQVKQYRRISVKLIVSNESGSDFKEMDIDLPNEDNTVKGISYSWWCDPISQYKNGFNYFSGIDTLGRQVMFLYHPQLNKTIFKVINTGHKRDEHNTAAFLFSGNQIITACAGHDQQNMVKLKVFDSNLNGPSLFEKNIIFPGSCSYAQLQRTGNRVFLATRCINKWYITWSDDEGVSWVEPKLFIKKDYRPNNSFYIRTIAVTDHQIKIGAYMHPVDMKDDGQRLYYASLDTQTGDVSKEDGQVLGNLYAPSYTAFDVFDMTLMLEPNVGETFRFLDIANLEGGTGTVFLIADAKSNDFAQGQYCLVERDHALQSSKLISIVPHGKSLPHPTYWGGAYFVVDYDYKWNGHSVFLAREAANHWMVEKYNYDGNSFSMVKQIEDYESVNMQTLSRPLPPMGSELGGLSVIYQKGLYYGWPSYTNWHNMELILVDASLNPITTGVNGEIIEIK